MPRKPDPQVEQRILQAALRLWVKGGQEALTMRAIARNAGTNTPTVYRRFKNRNDLVFALKQRTHRDVASALDPCGSPEAICEQYLAFALGQPYQFRLLHANTSERQEYAGPQLRATKWNTLPFVRLMRAQLAVRFGGSVSDLLSHALWALAHGTATIITSGLISDRQVRAMKDAFAAAVDTLTSSRDLAHSDLWPAPNSASRKKG